MTITDKLRGVQLFLPVSTGLILWYVFVIGYMMVDLVLTVIVNCFKHQPSHNVLFNGINNVLPIILTLDIMISFNTGIIKNGKIILDRKVANKQYLHTVYFYCDCIALLTSILQIIFQNTFMKEITLFHYLIFIKLTTAYFLDSLFKKYIIKSFTVALFYEVCKNFLILATLCHIIGSFYFYIDVLMYHAGWYQTNQLWIFSTYAYQNIYTSNFWIQYTYSYYVACVTLSGTAYGDIVPLNPHQNLYIFCCFIFPMLIYSFVYSSIFQALFNRRNIASRIRRYKFLAQSYLKSLGVSERVMNKILTYLQFTHKKNMIVDTQFIEGLAPTIKKQYLNQILEGKFQFDCFSSVLQVAQLDSDYIKIHLTTLIKQQFFPERFPLIDVDKLKIYYINTGKVVEVVKLNDSKKLSKTLPKLTHVAKTAFFTNQLSLNKFSIESNSFVMAHSIQYQQFRKVSKCKMPSFYQSFCYIQSKIIDEKQYHLMDEKCFFCDDLNHRISHCPHLAIQSQSYQNRNKEQQFQPRQRFNRDQIQKRQSINKLNIHKQMSLRNKISNNLTNMEPHYDRKSKKIYQRKQIGRQSMGNYQEMEQNKNYLQQTLQSDFIQQWNHSINPQRFIELEKVCIWDKFYPERNIIA